MSNTLLVQKYGGTSVGSIERIKAVAKRALDTQKEVGQLVVVVSAMGDTTDDLIDLAKQLSPQPPAREYDALISTGEAVSAALVAMAIQAQGGKAISLTGPQAGVKTEDLYSKAKITHVDTTRIHDELSKGNIVVITGFQGLNSLGDVTTIGRGGSDTSAVVLAAALKAKVCEIYTDVDGVYTTDPRLVKTASKLNEICYDEMLELASLGAKVLHPRAVESAKENNIILHVRSSFVADEGTLVKEEGQMEGNKPVTGATLSQEEAMISVLGIPDKPGFASTIFSKLATAAVSVDMIIQSTEQNGSNNITFTIDQNDLAQASQIAQEAVTAIGAKGLTSDPSLAKVSIVGVGMISKPGIAARMFTALGKHNINIKLISTSEIKISCAISREDGVKALQVLHSEFELDAK
jgi:aspartate kinase